MDQKLRGSSEVSLLINTILQPAIAGGMTEEEAEEIYNKIMENISNLGELDTGKTGFQDMRVQKLSSFSYRCLCFYGFYIHTDRLK